jgi:hypothetical protein
MIATILHRYWQSLLMWGAITVGIMLLLLGVRNAGRQAEKIDQMRGQNDALKESLRQRNIVDSGDADRMRERLNDRLRGRY